MRQMWQWIIVLADQVIKWWWIKNNTAIENRGIAFGLLAGDGWWMVAGAIITYLWWKKRGWPWQLIIGGGFSNLVDRVIRGGVVDGRWGFNLADTAIMIGSLWLILFRK